jgi:hypothetical protein
MGSAKVDKPLLANRKVRIATVGRILTDKDLPRLRKQWIEKFADLCREIPLRLPPLRPVNHEIHLIDPDKQYNY